MTTNDPPAGGNDTILLALSSAALSGKKGFSQITLIETQINADRLNSLR